MERNKIYRTNLELYSKSSEIKAFIKEKINKEMQYKSKIIINVSLESDS